MSISAVNVINKSATYYRITNRIILYGSCFYRHHHRGSLRPLSQYNHIQANRYSKMAPHADNNTNTSGEEVRHPSVFVPLEPGIDDATAREEMPKFPQ